MKLSLIISGIFILFIGFFACQKSAEKVELPAGMHAVKVIETTGAANYNYLLVSENGSNYWIAVPEMQVEIGETLYFTKSMEMKNFHSKSLNRDFESILFVEDISRTPDKKPHVAPHPQVKLAPVPDITVEHLKDGKTVEQIYNERKSLNGKKVRVRAKVVRYNPSIMDRNWIHIQDGTGSEGTHDLLVTSQDEANVGQIVIVEGIIATDIDLGAGYSYVVVMEKAKVTVEQDSEKAIL
ncbi:SH3-like domain-containing protein [candidate division KSB1 bacterium]|nr:SH3-like domain-containing protein [candidate division KSB1 bacterium]